MDLIAPSARHRLEGRVTERESPDSLIAKPMSFHVDAYTARAIQENRVPYFERTGSRSKRAVKLWRNKRGRNDRIVLALEDFSYVVVLEDRQDFVMLWAAYPVERMHRRRKLEREFEAYQKSEKG